MWQQGERNPWGTSRGFPHEEVHGIPDRSLVNSNTFKHWTAATEVPCQETAEKAWPLPFRTWQLTLILQPNADAWTPSTRLKKASAFPKYAEGPHRAPPKNMHPSWAPASRRGPTPTTHTLGIPQRGVAPLSFLYPKQGVQGLDQPHPTETSGKPHR